MAKQNCKPLSEVLDSFRKIHGDRYDYSKVVYLGNGRKIEIICPWHGSFMQLPSDHRHGSGCNKCSNCKPVSQLEFVQRCVTANGDQFDLSFAEYKGNKTKVKVICKHHGEIWATPVQLWAGSGCRYCGYEKQRATKLSARIISDPNTRDAFTEYRRTVRNLSNKNFIKFYHDINPTNLRRGKDYHLDHIVSIMAGFVDNIPAEIIAAPTNLRIISAEENRQKGVKPANDKSSFDAANIITSKPTAELLKIQRQKLSNKYQITDLTTNETVTVDLLVDWCAAHNLSVSSVRWAQKYQSTPFKGRYVIRQL